MRGLTHSQTKMKVPIFLLVCAIWIRRSCTALAVLLGAFLVSSTAVGAQGDFRQWQPLKKDGLHDPNNRLLPLLQEPAEALARLSPDTAGNQVNWVTALKKGEIQPRATIQPTTKTRVRDSVLLLNLKGGTPIVRFPHAEHTQWLDCANCHSELFKTVIGETKLNMRNILQGEQCGVCHGAVAFPLTECQRCHNTPRQAGVRYETSAKILTPATTKD